MVLWCFQVTTERDQVVWNELRVSLEIYESTLPSRRSQAYRNQSTELLCKSMDWFLYNRDLRHELVKSILIENISQLLSWLCFTFAVLIRLPQPHNMVYASKKNPYLLFPRRFCEYFWRAAIDISLLETFPNKFSYIIDSNKSKNRRKWHKSIIY